MIPKMRVLIVLSSSNQMYSGIGRAVFELTRRLLDRIQPEFAIDDLNDRNLNLVQTFADEHRLAVHVGKGRKRADALDNGNADLTGLLTSKSWDAIECVCWANADTNSTVIEHAGSTPFIFTPHHQPPWTVPMSEIQAEQNETVYQATIHRADLILCDSLWERDQLGPRTTRRNSVHYLPLGCDFRAHSVGSVDRRQQLLFVGDLTEPRKRFDRVIDLMERLHQEMPELRLIAIGNRTEGAESRIPASIRSVVDLRGFVTETELRAAYAQSLGTVLLSEFEAFGIPILESLAAGTPVFLSEMGPTRSLFGEHPGAHFCRADDPVATFAQVRATLNDANTAIHQTIADRDRLRARFDWDRLAHEKWEMMAACWYRKRAFGWAA